MAVDKARAVADLEKLMATALRCEEQLGDARKAYALGLAELRRGASVKVALAAGDAPAMRAAVTDALADLETARKVSRLSLIQADIAEGSGITAVALAWGVSRQLVSRYVHDGIEVAGDVASGSGTSYSTDTAPQRWR